MPIIILIPVIILMIALIVIVSVKVIKHLIDYINRDNPDKRNSPLDKTKIKDL